MTNGQCPKCGATVSYVNIESITIRAKPTSWQGVSYLCPSCNAVLSVAIDPISLKADTVSEIVDHMG